MTLGVRAVILFSLLLSIINVPSAAAATAVQLSNYGPATNCNWDTRQNYATLFQAGSTSTITQVRMQFEANAQDFAFNATRVQIYTNNAGVTGTLVGTLYPNTLAAAVTAPSATVSTRVGTYIGSTNVTSNTQYWYVIQGSGSILSACGAGGMVTQVNSWSMILNGGNYNLRTNGSYSTWSLMFILEITTGTPDSTPAIITGPLGLTTASVSTSTPENASWSNTYTANEFVSWSLSGLDSATFTINQSGLLSLGAKNFEVRSDSNSDGIFQVTVRATDPGNNIATQNLSLTIDDANDAPVISFNGGAATHSISVAENQTAVITYTGSDEDTGTVLTWYRADSSFDGTKFDLNPTTGILTFNVAPDFENTTDTNRDNIYKINVGAWDGAILTTQMLSVIITDVIESSSINKPTVSGILYKGIPGSITVISDNPGKVRFFINGKKIPTCLSVATTGTAPTVTAVCNFKPSVRGVHIITARLTPTNSGLTPSLSAQLMTTVSQRTSTR